MAAVLRSAAVSTELTRGEPLIARYLVTKLESELHWVQRWVAVYDRCIATHIREGEVPTRVFPLLHSTVEDRGDRHFVVTLLTTAEEPSPCTDSNDDELLPESVLFRTVTDDASSIRYLQTSLGEVATAPSLGESSSKSFRADTPGAVPVEPLRNTDPEQDAQTSTSNEDNDAMVFRCCDRFECLDMLQTIYAALAALQFHDAATQSSLSDFGLVEVRCSDVENWRRETELLRQENARLRLANEGVEGELGKCRALLLDEQRHSEALLRDAVVEQKRLLEAQRQALEQKRQAAIRVAEHEHELMVTALQREIAEHRTSLDASHRSREHERKLLEKRVAALEKRLRGARASLDAEAATDALRQFLAMRRDHLSWLRHHLCSEQIARFALSLKRASQILQPIPGAAQFAKEFRHDWPIAARLIELPVMIAEEDGALTRILASLRMRCSDGGPGPTPSAFRTNPPPSCASPHCGGVAAHGDHVCSPFSPIPTANEHALMVAEEVQSLARSPEISASISALTPPRHSHASSVYCKRLEGASLTVSVCTPRKRGLGSG